MKEQIEEMTKDLCDIECKGMKCNECDGYGCEYRVLAEALYNVGYRKQSENVIELPCKIGDIVYVITEKHPCYACMCVDDFCHKSCILEDKTKLVVKAAKVFYFLLQETSNKIQVEVEQTKNLVMHFLHFEIEDFGKTVFLTKEEAEEALAKMEGGAEY